MLASYESQNIERTWQGNVSRLRGGVIKQLVLKAPQTMNTGFITVVDVENVNCILPHFSLLFLFGKVINELMKCKGGAFT